MVGKLAGNYEGNVNSLNMVGICTWIIHVSVCVWEYLVIRIVEDVVPWKLL